MLEVEVKAACDDLASLQQQLIELGCTFGAPVMQDDTIYISEGKTLESLLPGDNVLRIRTTTTATWTTTHLFTLKQQSWNDLAKQERETAIQDPKQMHDSLLMMGYMICSTVHKRRQKTSYHDKEICLDTVHGLGSFIEVEQLTTDGDVDEIQEQLFSFLTSLGIDRSARVTKGYDVLLYEKAPI